MDHAAWFLTRQFQDINGLEITIAQMKKTYGIESDQYSVEVQIDPEMTQFLKGITVSMITGVVLFETIFITVFNKRFIRQSFFVTLFLYVTSFLALFYQKFFCKILKLISQSAVHCST